MTKCDICLHFKPYEGCQVKTGNQREVECKKCIEKLFELLNKK